MVTTTNTSRPTTMIILLIFSVWNHFIIVLRGCLPEGVNEHVISGSDTYVCLNIAPLTWIAPGTYNNSGLYVRSPNTVKADQVSNLNIRKSWTSMDYYEDVPMQTFGIYPGVVGSGLGVSVESMGVLSYQRAFRLTLNNTKQVTFPLMMAIINVNKGKVSGISWDNDLCSWCDGSQCAPNTYDFGGTIQTNGKACWIEDKECNLNPRNNGTIVSDLCQLNVFVVWSGTDQSGRYFKSAATRFSRLASTQLMEITNARKKSKAVDNQ